MSVDRKAIGPATTYAVVLAAVQDIIAANLTGNDASRVAYFAGRAALLQVYHTQGPERAAEMAYRLGDEFAAAGRP